MLKVFGCPNTRSLRVVWALEEIGVDYEYVKVDLRKGDGRRPPYIDLNPTGKVPTLVDGALTLSESGAILTYLGERFPAAALVPGADRPLQRAAYFQWAFFVLCELEQPLWTLSKHRFALPEKWRVAQIEDTARWEFAVAAKVLDKHMRGRTFAVGERFSAADILIAHTLLWARSAKVTFDFPALANYADSILARPALARAREREATA